MPRKKFDDIFSRLNTIHERDGQTDRRIGTARQQRPRLRIASRSKQDKACFMTSDPETDRAYSSISWARMGL